MQFGPLGEALLRHAAFEAELADYLSKLHLWVGVHREQRGLQGSAAKSGGTGGLDPEVQRLFIIDGSKALRSARMLRPAAKAFNYVRGTYTHQRSLTTPELATVLYCSLSDASLLLMTIN